MDIDKVTKNNVSPFVFLPRHQSLVPKNFQRTFLEVQT